MKNLEVRCEYINKCPSNITKYSMKCVFGKEDCSIYQFYKKYGKDYEQMFVGSKVHTQEQRIGNKK